MADPVAAPRPIEEARMPDIATDQGIGEKLRAVGRDFALLGPVVAHPGAALGAVAGPRP